MADALRAPFAGASRPALRGFAGVGVPAGGGGVGRGQESSIHSFNRKQLLSR